MLTIQLRSVALSLGPLKIHWYGLMYWSPSQRWWLGTLRAKRPARAGTEESATCCSTRDGRHPRRALGYVLFYDLWRTAGRLNISNLASGMSFHGGLIGRDSGHGVFCTAHTRIFSRSRISSRADSARYGADASAISSSELWRPRHDVRGAWCFRSGSGATPSVTTVSGVPRRHRGVHHHLAVFHKPRRQAVSGLFLVSFGCYQHLCGILRSRTCARVSSLSDWLTMGQLLWCDGVLARSCWRWHIERLKNKHCRATRVARRTHGSAYGGSSHAAYLDLLRSRPPTRHA